MVANEVRNDGSMVSSTISDPDLVNSGVKDKACKCESAMFNSRSCSYEVVPDDEVVMDFIPDELTAYRSCFLVGTYSKVTREIVHIEMVPADKIMLFLSAMSNLRVADFVKQKPSHVLSYPKEFRYVIMGLLDKSTLKYVPIELALEKSFYDRLPLAIQSFIDNGDRINSEGQSMPF